MADTHRKRWTRMLEVDRGDGGAQMFADKCTPRQLFDKHRSLIDAAGRAAARAAAFGAAADGTSRQLWSKEQEVYLLQMVKTHGPKWSHILKVDRGNDGANKFADGRAPKHLRDKHRHLIDTAARAAAAEATDHA